MGSAFRHVSSAAASALVAIVAACGSHEGSSVTPAPGAPGGPADTAASPPPPVATSSSSPADATPPCPKAPCAARPIVFVHGHNGSSDDFKPILDGLVQPSPTARFDDYRFVGTGDHAPWPTRGIGRRSWLFAFDYYVAKGTDARGSFTAGPGRVGSNRAMPCASPAGTGGLVADGPSYDEGSSHDYAEDLASMIADVLRATGADSVDLVAHSLGGLVVRSFLAFYDGGGTHVRTLMLLASPHQGVLGAPLEALVGAAQPWMAAHELTELAGRGLFAKSHFMRCGDAPNTYADWPSRLLDQEVEHPIVPAVHVMSGSKDLFVSYDNADHPQEKSHVVVDGADHPGILKAPETLARVDELCGGAFTP